MKQPETKDTKIPLAEIRSERNPSQWYKISLKISDAGVERLHCSCSEHANTPRSEAGFKPACTHITCFLMDPQGIDSVLTTAGVEFILSRKRAAIAA
jgi:hypothetical protein